MRTLGAVALVLALGCRAESVLVEPGAATVWKYFDKDTEPAQWRAPEFDDATWAAGPAPLGYGAPHLATTLSYGGKPDAKFITAYFRRAFEVPDPKTLARLEFLIRSDDGVIVYLNGKEVARNNLPAEGVTHATTATEALAGFEQRLFHRYKCDAGALVAGKNLLAVEVHQCDPRSSDLVLDLLLKAFASGEEPHPSLAQAAKAAAEAYRYKHYVGPELSIPDGYLDGGRGMRLDAEGHASSSRELIRVDRSHDAALQVLLAFARSEELKRLEPLERARSLIERVVATSELSELAEYRGMLAFTRQFANEAVNIGDVGRYCGATVCRHRSLLLKILGPEAGLRIALVRGNYDIDGAHAWNELHLADGSRMIMDAMQTPADRLLPLSKATHYLTVDNKPWYPAEKSTSRE